MRYKVREENQEFFLKGRKISDTTIIVTFYTDKLDHYYYTLQSYQKSAQLIYENHVLVGYEVYYGKIDISSIYKICQEENELNLDECYLSNFSFSDYLKFCGYDQDIDLYTEKIKFPQSISGRLAFFENVNFSGLYAESLEFLSYGSFFSGEFADFSKITLQKGFLDFSKIFVAKDLEFSLSFTHIYYGDILFHSSYFEEGNRYLVSLYLHNGSLNLTNTYLMGGMFDLSYSSIQGTFYADKMYVTNLELNLTKTFVDSLLFSSTEIRNSTLYLCDMDIGDGNKNFKEMYLQNSNLFLDNSNFGNGEVIFSYLEALDNCIISLKKTTFSSEFIDFSYSMIQGYLEFSDATLSNATLNFEESSLDIVSFNAIKSRGVINFRAKECYALSLKNAIIGELFDISTTIRFTYLQLSSLVLSGKITVSWYGNNIDQAIKNMYYQEIHSIKNIFIPKLQDSKIKELKLMYAESYRMLKDNFNMIHKYPDEDISYIIYRRALRRYHSHTNSIFKRFGYFFEWLVLDVLGGYGTDPWRALIAIGIVWAGFAGAYYYFDSFHISDASAELNRWQRGVYHSGITLFTVGYGDLVPKGMLMRTLSMIEGLLGVLLPSYFMIAFTRKMLR